MNVGYAKCWCYSGKNDKTWHRLKLRLLTEMEPVMRILPVLFILTTLLIISKSASAETVQIEFTKFDTYSTEVVHIDIGDSVEWLPESAGHNVEFIAGPNMDALPKSSKMDDLHSVVFKTPGIYLYGCTPHLNMGMLGLVIVGNNLQNLEKIHDVKLSRIAKSILENLIIIAKSHSE